MSTDKRSIEWYNQNSERYTKHVRDPNDSIFHSQYEKPAMYNALPKLNGMAVLSLGCGSGEDCLYLFKCGAKKVIGIDISSEMIKIAKSSYPECDFKEMDMEKLDFEDSSFDFVYSSLAIHYLEDWTKVFSEVYRVLKPNSYFLFSCNHPVSSAMELVKDNKDFSIRELSRTKYRKINKVDIVGNYMDRKSSFGQGNMDVTTWHKSFGEISMEAASAGFFIANIIEPLPLPSMKELSPTSYQSMMKIPDFLILKLLKP